MANGNVTRIPVTHDQRKRNRLGPRYAHDEVSGRLIHFGEVFDGDHKTLVDVQVYADPADDGADIGRRLCKLFVPLDDLRRVIGELEADASAE